MSNKRKLRTGLLFLLVLSSVLAACGPAATPTPAPAEPTQAPSEATAPPEESEEKLTFALITKTLNNPFWDMMHSGAQEFCEENGYELIYLAPTKPNNLEEQNRLMDDVIARQVDGIVLAPVDSAGVVPAIERAVAAGIPVAVSATGASTDQIVTYSGTDNYEGMKMVAEYVAEALDYQGKVVVLDGLLGATVGQDRRRGVDETLEQYPDIEILGRQDAEMQRAKGMQVMENLLQAYPEIDAVIAANDEEALGAIEALDAAGRLQDTIVSGFDGNNDALKAVRDGRMLVTLVQGPEKMAVDAIKAILDDRAGKDVPKRIVTEMILATQDNIDQFSDRIGEPEAEATAPPEEKLTFALITKTLNNPFWDMMHSGAQEFCEENGYELIYLAPTKPNNLEEQNRLMDDVIARQVDGIVLAPVDSAGVVPAIERAVAAGIPVAVSATGASTDQIVTYSGTDNYEGMKMVAEYVAEALDYQGKVVVLDGLLGATVGQDRRRGVDETLEQYPDIEILGRQDAEMQRAKGMQVMENLLQAYPEIDAVIAANDEEALGAIEALDAAGRLQDTIVSGFDGNNDALKAVRDGRMLVTLVQGPEKMAVDAIKAILDHRAGKDVPKRLVTEMILATQDNIDQFADRIGE